MKMGIIVEKLLVVYFKCILRNFKVCYSYIVKAEDANVYNRNFLDSIHMEMRVIDSLEPDLTTKILGVEYASPIMMPAFSHLNKVGKDGKKPMIEYAKVAKELNMLN